MTSSDAITAVIDQYERNGWVLRRLKLTDRQITTGIFSSDVVVTMSESNLGWFSRPPKTGKVAWELRSLADPPIALVVHIDEDLDDVESILVETEDRLSEMVAGRGRA